MLRHVNLVEDAYEKVSAVSTRKPSRTVK